MRWDELFDDLESQMEHELTAEEIDIQAEEERLRIARLTIRDRLRSLHDARVPARERVIRLALGDGTRVAVVPSAFGRDWFAGDLVEESGRRSQCIIPIEAIDGILLEQSQILHSLEPMVGESTGALSARLGLPFVLRDICRRRASVHLHLRATRLHGTIDRVGRDHLDIAIHEQDQPRRDSAISEYRIVRLGELVLVRY